MVKADFNDEGELAAAMEGAYGCFLITDFWSTMNMDKEIKQVRFQSYIFILK